MLEQQITVGMEITIDRKKHVVGYAGKEVRLDAKDGSSVWRHSRTIGRLLAGQAEAKARSARKPRGSKTAKKLEETLARAAADAAEAQTPATPLVEA